jgi:hypothetical protein
VCGKRRIRLCGLAAPDSPEQLDQLLDQIGSVDGVEKTTIILSSKVDRGQPL